MSVGGDRPAVASDRRIRAVIRKAQHIPVPRKRGVAGTVGVVGGLAVRAVEFPGPVLERKLTLEARRELPDGVVVYSRTRRHPAVIVGGRDQPRRPLSGRSGTGRSERMVQE